MNNSKPVARATTKVRRSPRDVFAAFADAGKMSRFWFTRYDDGLKAGEKSRWFLGPGDDAFSFEVQVREVRVPDRLVIEWTGPDGNSTQVTWSFEETGDGDTILTIEESGYVGSSEAVVRRALDSTGGFNQVIIAAKALVEHDVGVNVVNDRAQ